MTTRPRQSFLLDKAQPKQQMVTNHNKIEDADKQKKEKGKIKQWAMHL